MARIRMGRWNGVLTPALAVVLIGWPTALPAQGDQSQADRGALNQRAFQLYKQGEYQKATELFEQGVKIAIKEFGPDHLKVATSLDNLALVYQTQGRTPEAEPLCQRSLKIREAQLGPDHPDVATSVNNLALMYQSQGRSAEAEPLYQRSLKIREAKLEPDDLAVANSLNNLASLYRSQGRYAEAEPLFQRSLKISEARLGPDRLTVAVCLNNLALLYQWQGRPAEAEPLYRRSLKIRETKLGPDHPDVAENLNNLAGLYQLRGRYAEAEPLYQRSLKIVEAKLGPDHPEVTIILFNLASLHAARGHWPDAVDEEDRARRASLRHIVRVLPALAEKEQLTFLEAADEGVLQGALSLALVRSDDHVAAARSAGWVLNGKGQAQQALAERVLLARGGQDPAAAQLVAQIRQVRTRLATLTLATPSPGQESDRQRELARLDEHERELSKQLGQVTGRPHRDDPWVETDAVRKALPAEAVLIEIARFRIFNFEANGIEKMWQPPHYAAWVIPAVGRRDVRIIDLGPAVAIDTAVTAARTALKVDPQALRTRGEPVVEQQARPPLEALARLVLTPLLPHISTTRRWIISPDAALWLVPWAALPLDREKYAIEDHEIGYVISGRDLVRNGGRPSQEPAVVMADPDFELAADQSRRAARAVVRRREDSPAPEVALPRLSRTFRLDVVTRLAGTAAEAQAIAPRLRAYTGAEPIVYTDRWALEAVFKALQRPRVVVLSTHGFFLEDPESQTEEPPVPGLDRGRPRHGPLPENPLLRCGLLLAGCSRSDRRAQGEDEDGILTGLEIVGTDLRGTELVVVSACETAVGQVHSGEGVAGLRQAFQLAGAQAVVATLWPTPDRESARLMIGFFDNLAAGQDRAAAMRNAQLALIASRRERYGAAHPFFWAAFTVTGETGPR